MKKYIYAWWFTSDFFKNFGDEVAPYVLEKLTGAKVLYIDIQKSYFRGLLSYFYTFVKTGKYPKDFILKLNPFRKICISVGSVAQMAKNKCIVWGAGLMNENERPLGGKFYAVRGYKTAEQLSFMFDENNIGIGDPALLLPLLYKPQIEKKYKMGIIPHHVNHKKIDQLVTNKDILIIDLSNRSVEEVIDDICSCEFTVADSLHGIIVSHAYNVPSLRIFIAPIGGDGIKFEDYYSSINMPFQFPIEVNEENKININDVNYFHSKINSQIENYPNQQEIKKVQESLLKTFPYKIQYSLLNLEGFIIK